MTATTVYYITSHLGQHILQSLPEVCKQQHALPNNNAPCAAQLNLTQYWGVWGGKYCYSAYDPPPPPGKNNTKAPCPAIKQPPVPKIRPVDLPRISQLSGGQIFVGGASSQPIQIKVIH